MYQGMILKVSIRLCLGQRYKGYSLKKNEGRVYFALYGDDFDPDEMTEYLGIEPTSVEHKGSRIPEKFPRTNSWELSTSEVVSEYIDVFDMATEVVNQLKHKKNLIIKAKKKFKVSPKLAVVLMLSMNKDHSLPAIGFEVETIEFLGEIGDFIDIDTYKH